VGDLAADYQLLRTGSAAVPLARDAVRVTGPDGLSFLQGQCSQDVAGLAVGASTWSLVLQPQGKVDALVRITRVADDSVVLDTDGGWGPRLLERLRRFKLRVKAELELLPWTCIALRGPGAPDEALAVVAGPELLVVDASWPGWPGVDLLGAEPLVPPGVAVVSGDAYQVARIEAGIPMMGAELTERTIPAETGIVERTVSFTKGCFTGQELVARIDSRGGHVPRHLRAVVLSEAVPPAGAAVLVDGKQVGVLTSVAATPGGGAVALAYIGRDVEPPASATAEWEGGGRGVASIRTLPLVK
jgi:tRNA-modifying protein YgfZ